MLIYISMYTYIHIYVCVCLVGIDKSRFVLHTVKFCISAKVTECARAARPDICR